MKGMIMNMKICYDFHIHSCLSPCGSDDMTPEMIINCATAKELDAVALTDHNTTGNCEAFLYYAKKSGITAFAGMELQTAEDIHVVCLFKELKEAGSFDEYVSSKLPDIKNDTDIFGNQIKYNVNGDNDIISKLLLVGADIPFYGLYELVAEFGGIAIPAHADKDSFSMKSVLGSVDKLYGFPLVELLDENNNEGLRYIQSSDSHNIDTFFDSPYRIIEVKNNTKEEIFRYLKGDY